MRSKTLLTNDFELTVPNLYHTLFPFLLGHKGFADFIDYRLPVFPVSHLPAIDFFHNSVTSVRTSLC